MSSRPSKSARSDDLIRIYTWGSCSIFSEFGFPEVGGDQAAGECLSRCEGRITPAKKHLKETIDHLKKEVEDLKAEKAKSKPAQGRKYSARQESDKKASWRKSCLY